jgi:hypothetical protein
MRKWIVGASVGLVTFFALQGGHMLSAELVSSEFAPYVELFERMYGEPIEVPIMLTSDKDTLNEALGICYIYQDDTREIFIDEAQWYELSQVEQEMLILHELGHCILDRPDDNTVFLNGVPKSLMYGKEFLSKHVRAYKKNRAFYLNELFNY